MSIRKFSLTLLFTLPQIVCSCDASSSGTISDAGSVNGGSSNAGNSSVVGGQSSLTGSGGRSSQGGASAAGLGGTSSTQGCPAWPQAKLPPIVGPFFYGTNPGPCTLTSSGTVFTFTYDTSNRVIRQANSDGSTVTTYTYNQGVLVSETLLTSGSTTSTTTYQYSANSVSYTTVNATGTTSQFTYTLDSQGYPQTVTATGTNLGTSFPPRYTYIYDNCRLVERVAYLSDNTESVANDMYYTFDSLGRLTERKTASVDEVYDYSCW